jgi:hypothetical protein
MTLLNNKFKCTRVRQMCRSGVVFQFCLEHHAKKHDNLAIPERQYLCILGRHSARSHMQPENAKTRRSRNDESAIFARHPGKSNLASETPNVPSDAMSISAFRDAQLGILQNAVRCQIRHLQFFSKNAEMWHLRSCILAFRPECRNVASQKPHFGGFS